MRLWAGGGFPDRCAHSYSERAQVAQCAGIGRGKALVMSCAENGGSILTNGGAVSRRVREEASSDARHSGRFSGSWEPREDSQRVKFGLA